MDKEISAAIDRNFTSPNVSDRNMEHANLVDVFDDISRAFWRITALYECDLRNRLNIPSSVTSNQQLRDFKKGDVYHGQAEDEDNPTQTQR